MKSSLFIFLFILSIRDGVMPTFLFKGTVFRRTADITRTHPKISYQPVEEDPQLFKLFKNPACGYNYDACIRIPENWDLTNKHLLVTPNNTAVLDNRSSVHDQKTYNAIRYGWEGRVSLKMRVPALFPVFHNPDRNPVIFPHALTRASIFIEDGMMERLDRQLINMIKDARILILTI